jgi:hypothetical protein
MKTILCPVNFSPQSERLLKYVADLARDRNGKVYLISSRSSKEKVVAMSGTLQEDNRLDEWSSQLNEIHRVASGIVHGDLEGNIYKKLSNVADRYDIMVIMINSSDKKSHELNVKKIIQDALAPLLVIPDRFTYQPIKRLLYAYDYKHEEEPPLMQLNWLSDWFNAPMVFVTLMPGDTSIHEERKLNSIQTAIKNSWKDKHSISFETILYSTMSRGFENYVGLSEMSDLLVLSINHQNMLERIWHKRVVKGVFQYTQRPYLILHD